MSFFFSIPSVFFWSADLFIFCSPGKRVRLLNTWVMRHVKYIWTYLFYSDHVQFISTTTMQSACTHIDVFFFCLSCVARKAVIILVGCHPQRTRRHPPSPPRGFVRLPVLVCLQFCVRVLVLCVRVLVLVLPYIAGHPVGILCFECWMCAVCVQTHGDTSVFYFLELDAVRDRFSFLPRTGGTTLCVCCVFLCWRLNARRTASFCFRLRRRVF